MKSGDLIRLRLVPGTEEMQGHLRLVVEEFEVENYRFFRMITDKGNLLEWPAENIERFWETVK